MVFGGCSWGSAELTVTVDGFEVDLTMKGG